jgi:hypothetical protein
MVNMQKAWSKNRCVIFALFAAGILFAMVREWNAPVVCWRLRQTGVSAKFASLLSSPFSY